MLSLQSQAEGADAEASEAPSWAPRLEVSGAGEGLPDPRYPLQTTAKLNCQRAELQVRPNIKVGFFFFTPFKSDSSPGAGALAGTPAQQPRL